MGEGAVDPLKAAYGLLIQAFKDLAGPEEQPVRDSDLKRRMLEIQPGFDEGELGFGKFSRFLRQAHDHEVVDLQKREEGTYQVAFRREFVVEGGSPPARRPGPGRRRQGSREPAPSEGVGEGTVGPSSPVTVATDEPSEGEVRGEDTPTPTPAPSTPSQVPLVPGTPVRLRPGSGRKKGPRGQEGPPPLLEGQVIQGSRAPAQEAASAPPPEPEQPSASPAASRTPRRGQGSSRPGGQEEITLDLPLAPGEAPDFQPMAVGPLDLGALGLPTDATAMVRYLTHSYKGVGQKTAESLVEAFGAELYQVMADDPARVARAIPPRRAEHLLSAWRADLTRRLERKEEGGGGGGGEGQTERSSPSRRRTRRGGRGRGRDEAKSGNGGGGAPGGESGS